MWIVHIWPIPDQLRKVIIYADNTPLYGVVVSLEHVHLCGHLRIWNLKQLLDFFA